MFTPMNGRKLARIGREAIFEWNNEGSGKKPLFLNRQMSQILMDAIRFYLHFLRNRYSNFDSVCKMRHDVLGNYGGKSNVWRFIMQHVIDGVLKIENSSKFCATQQYRNGNSMKYS